MKQQDYFSSNNIKRFVVLGFFLVSVVFLINEISKSVGINSIGDVNANIRTTSFSSVNLVDIGRSIRNTSRLQDTNSINLILTKYYQYYLKYPESLKIVDNKIYIEGDDKVVPNGISLNSVGLTAFVLPGQCPTTTEEMWTIIYHTNGDKYDLAACLESSNSNNLSIDPLTQF